MLTTNELFTLNGWKKYDIDNGFVGEPVRSVPVYAQQAGNLEIKTARVRLTVHENLWFENPVVSGVSLFQ